MVTNNSNLVAVNRLKMDSSSDRPVSRTGYYHATLLRDLVLVEVVVLGVVVEVVILDTKMVYQRRNLPYFLTPELPDRVH